MIFVHESSFSTNNQNFPSIVHSSMMDGVQFIWILGFKAQNWDFFLSNHLISLKKIRKWKRNKVFLKKSRKKWNDKLTKKYLERKDCSRSCETRKKSFFVLCFINCSKSDEIEMRIKKKKQENQNQSGGFYSKKLDRLCPLLKVLNFFFSNFRVLEFECSKLMFCTFSLLFM